MRVYEDGAGAVTEVSVGLCASIFLSFGCSGAVDVEGVCIQVLNAPPVQRSEITGILQKYCIVVWR
jgi:hypothetical protein